ncbi:hypothetical protein ACEPPN_019059 [Leptodophora sp. 'Broadleaf-Isolate-01']
MLSSSLSGAALMLFLAQSAVADLNLQEHLVLADCGIGHDQAHPDWANSFQMLYYKGAVWNNPDLSSPNRPDMVAQVPWDGQYPWRAQWNWQGSKGTFPNGDVFSAVAFPGIADPNLAGTVTHIYEPHPLRCFSFHKARFLHQLANGQRCSTAYVRNHQEGNQLQIGTSPSPPAEQKVNTRVSINKDKAILNGNSAFDDIFNLSKINDDICDESTIEVPNSRDRWGGPCSIKFRCHGNKKGLAEAMRTGLKNTAKESDMFYHNLHQTKPVWNPCKSGRDICIGGDDTFFFDETYMPQSLTVYVNYEGGADLGEMRYDLFCPAKGANSCDGAKFGIAVTKAWAGLFGPLIGGAVSVVASAICP